MMIKIKIQKPNQRSTYTPPYDFIDVKHTLKIIVIEIVRWFCINQYDAVSLFTNYYE